MRLSITNRIPAQWNRELMVDLIRSLESQVNQLSEGRAVAHHASMTAAPTTGFWGRGDWVKNSEPSAGGYFGWVCVTGGNPGTWKGFGEIEA